MILLFFCGDEETKNNNPPQIENGIFPHKNTPLLQE
jgi:hypothetical protein